MMKVCILFESMGQLGFFRKKNNEPKQKNVDVINNYVSVNEQLIEIEICRQVIWKIERRMKKIMNKNRLVQLKKMQRKRNYKV